MWTFARFSVQVAGLPCNVRYGRDHRVNVHFRHSLRGSYGARLELWFEDTKLNEKFAIVRTAAAIVGNKEDYDRLLPVAPFVPRKHTTRDRETTIIEGVRPASLGYVRYVVSLPESPIPGYISSALSQGSPDGIVSYFRKSLLPRVLDSTTYGRHFKHLLWAEEYRSESVLSSLLSLIYRALTTYEERTLKSMTFLMPSSKDMNRITSEPRSLI